MEMMESARKLRSQKGIAGKEDVIVPNPVNYSSISYILKAEQPEKSLSSESEKGSDGSQCLNW